MKILSLSDLSYASVEDILPSSHVHFRTVKRIADTLRANAVARDRLIKLRPQNAKRYREMHDAEVTKMALKLSKLKITIA